MPTILDQIIARVLADLPAAEATVPRATLMDRIASRPPRAGFRAALAAQTPTPRIIAELKKASPSKGLIRPDFDPVALAQDLARGGAAALSVLTEPHYFQGAPAYLEAVAAAVDLPLLRKDFIVSDYQILEARAWGASAILLIVAALERNHLRDLYQTARGLGLDVLCEIHDRPELETALACGADLVGINSRNLKTFTVNLDPVIQLLQDIPPGIVRVAESGLDGPAAIARLRAAGAQGFLIGERLMRQTDPGQTLAAWLAGRAD
ncbi:MAG: indole-3-glycerol phosphate synthase TrpC [Candidatus Marinimicrobia bacterium]|nr:indole-3-glycerol phosphate synthase TrpC [Candidatus Neomarinimicrobiota bacterium]